MLVSHDSGPCSMTVHGHHAGCRLAAWRCDMMHDEVSMHNHDAASDGGRSDCVSVTDANSTRPSTVYLSALAIGDEMSCAAVQVESAGLCVKLCPAS